MIASHVPMLDVTGNLVWHTGAGRGTLAARRSARVDNSTIQYSTAQSDGVKTLLYMKATYVGGGHTQVIIHGLALAPRLSL